MRSIITSITIASLCIGMGCAKKGEIRAPSEKELTKVAKDGLPEWVGNPYMGRDKGKFICTDTRSDFASADVEGAKTDAEVAAKNRLADQVKGQVSRVTERYNSVMKDLTQGKVVGERTLKDINENFVQMSLPGLRFEHYFFHPDRVNPETVFVLACIDFDSVSMSKELAKAMLEDAKVKDELEFDHQEAMNRFETVRQKYLGEDKPAAAASPEPAAPAAPAAPE